MIRTFITSTILSFFIMAPFALAAPSQPVPNAHPALADYAIPACTDNKGEKVSYVSTEEIRAKPLVYVAGARYLNPDNLSKPAIFYDPEMFKKESKLVRDFVFAHECYHLSSGDVHRSYEHHHQHGTHTPKSERDSLEYDADCHAAYRMRHDFGYTARDMAGLRQMVNLTTPTHKQDRRMQDIMACFETNRPI